jgi:hypothetical protein
MAESKLIVEFASNIKGMAGKLLGEEGGETGKSTTEEGEDKTDKKNKKSMFGKIGKMLTGVLGIQVTFAAMLRQSQIATGFLGAVFQVLGAILDSFLLAFAPQLFGIVEHLAKLIPIAREIGEQVALQVGNLWERIKEFTTWLTPILIGIWNFIKGVFNWFAELAPVWKKSLAMLLIVPRLLAFFKVGFWIKGGMVIFARMSAALAVHRAKSAAMASASGGGAGGAAMMIPQLRIAAIVVAVAMLMFSFGFAKKNRDEDKMEGSVDVSGQLGKRYLPSQASQLGGTLNEAYSAIIQPFTDNVKPEMESFGDVIHEVNPVVADVVKEMAALKEVVPIDEYYNTVAGMDAVINAQEVAQQAILDATDNWATDLSKKTGAQMGSYDLLLTGTDLAGEAVLRQAKAIDDANTNWEVGSTQSKNQFVSTASFMHDAAVEMSDKTTNVIAKSFSDEAMGSMTGGLKTFDTNLAMLNQDMTDRNRDLIEAAEKQKEAAIDFQLMTGTVTSNFEENRRLQVLHQEEIRDSSIMANDKMLSYLSSLY